MGYSNAVQWGYDDENNLSSQTQTLNGNTYTTQYTYGKDNRLTKTTVGNISASYTYDAYGRMTGIVTKNGDSTVLNSPRGALLRVASLNWHFIQSCQY